MVRDYQDEKIGRVVPDEMSWYEIFWREKSRTIQGGQVLLGPHQVHSFENSEQYSVHLIIISCSPVRHFPDFSCIVANLPFFSVSRSLTRCILRHASTSWHWPSFVSALIFLSVSSLWLLLPHLSFSSGLVFGHKD